MGGVTHLMHRRYARSWPRASGFIGALSSHGLMMMSEPSGFWWRDEAALELQAIIAMAFYVPPAIEGLPPMHAGRSVDRLGAAPRSLHDNTPTRRYAECLSTAAARAHTRYWP